MVKRQELEGSGFVKESDDVCSEKVGRVEARKAVFFFGGIIQQGKSPEPIKPLFSLVLVPVRKAGDWAGCLDAYSTWGGGVREGGSLRRPLFPLCTHSMPADNASQINSGSTMLHPKATSVCATELRSKRKKHKGVDCRYLVG